MSPNVFILFLLRMITFNVNESISLGKNSDRSECFP